MKTDGLRPGNLVFSTQLSYLKWQESTALMDKNGLSSRKKNKKLPHPKISDAQMVIFSHFLKLGEIRTAAHKLEAQSKCFFLKTSRRSHTRSSAVMLNWHSSLEATVSKLRAAAVVLCNASPARWKYVCSCILASWQSRQERKLGLIGRPAGDKSVI